MADESHGTSRAASVGSVPLSEGWQPDPWGAGSLRWWDGQRWTGRVSSISDGDRPPGSNPQAGADSVSRSVREIKFREAIKGYKRGSVDALLDQVAEELDAGRSPVALVSNAKFPEALKGYRKEDVDGFLGLLSTTWQSSSGLPRADPSVTRRDGPGRKSPPSKVHSRRQRTLSAVIATVLVLALTGYMVGTFVADQIGNAAFARKGVVTQAKVMKQSQVDEGDSSTEDYLWVWVPGSSYDVRVPTTNPTGHPVGSLISVRYDPKNPLDVRPMVDNNNGWLEDLGVFVAYLFLMWVYLAWAIPTNQAWRRRRSAAVPLRGEND